MRLPINRRGGNAAWAEPFTLFWNFDEEWLRAVQRSDGAEEVLCVMEMRFAACPVLYDFNLYNGWLKDSISAIAVCGGVSRRTRGTGGE